MKRPRDPAFVVRRARPADLPQVANLLSELSAQPLTTRGAANRLALITGDPEQDLFVACADREVAGVLGFRIRHNIEEVSRFGEVSVLVVARPWRKRGVARALLERADVLARRRRCVGLWLVSGWGREASAHKFYRHLGFEETGVRFVRLFDEQ